MAETVQRLPRTEQVNIFGVRHLSPASAYHLLAYLRKLRPKCVLIEGAEDCGDLLINVADRRVKPPIALLAYTTQTPIKTVLYPFAEYSPEYQAICWAFNNKAEVRFIDLPTAVTIRANPHRNGGIEHDDTDIGADNGSNKDDENNGEKKDADNNKPHINSDNVSCTNSIYYEMQSKFYADIVDMADEHDYETFWERHFEHCTNTDFFTEKISELSSSMRGRLEGLQWATEEKDAAYNHVREAYMKMQIEKAIKQGYSADEIVVVVGAYHVKGLSDETLLPMTDDEYNKLPFTDIKTTLMPYSYYRLSSKSGYGAGNKSPAYYKLMWECMQKGNLDNLAPVYLSSIGSITRNSGNYNSTASVIEAVRLAKSLAHMHGGEYPALKDLRDSAVCLLGNGELSAVSEAIMRVDIGTEIGELPEGISQTPVQDDMNRQLKRLKLERYKSVIAKDIDLDIRENRSVKSIESAYLDLNRSVFFHRLQLLGIHFVSFLGIGQSVWNEKWVLRWSPENEIEVVETTLKGETIETAAAFVLKERFDEANNILDIAKLISEAFVCRLPSEIPNGLMRLQTLCIEGENFNEAAYTAQEIANVIKYKDVRNVDTTPLVPILQQIFLRAVLIMFDGASCNDEAADEFVKAIDVMHNVSQEQFEYVNDELWLQKLREIIESDSRNAKISGVATAILMERGKISDEDLKTEVERRLSYGVPGDLAALWFEGLSMRNRFVLLSRISIWEQLDKYLETLDSNEFRRSLVFLRRAFSSFKPDEKNSITDILASSWNIESTSIGEFLQNELSEEEQGALDDINDFDFDFDI